MIDPTWFPGLFPRRKNTGNEFVNECTYSRSTSSQSRMLSSWSCFKCLTAQIKVFLFICASDSFKCFIPVHHEASNGKAASVMPDPAMLSDRTFGKLSSLIFLNNSIMCVSWHWTQFSRSIVAINFRSLAMFLQALQTRESKQISSVRRNENIFSVISGVKRTRSAVEVPEKDQHVSALESALTPIISYEIRQPGGMGGGNHLNVTLER